ncbi:hypothetical protein J4760_09470 [Salinicoccus sp. ID82-1]|uniref:ABC transporter permease n=1 Tax=Salinicoccus sp. ID82-1 TaxID=2820269 RepID=UPI001F1AAF11|nr:hypothetical protein [Salinicoccus sp. ID82-1]MCG1010250.1 hypothetical protein [Salinicoccus sp. ID82-1]
MKSATSLLNRTLLSHFMGGIFWLTVLFLIGNILIQPLYLWIASVNYETISNIEFMSDNPLDTTFPFQLAGGMVYIVFMVMFLFSYKNKEASIDFMHSMPVKRRKLLTHALIAGVINIIVPLVVTAVVLFFQRYFLVFDITVMNIVEWFFYTSFALLVVFAISVFVGFLVNSMFVHMQMVVIVFFLPLVFWGLTVTVAEMFYEGITTVPSAGEGGLMGIVVNNTFPIFAIQQVYEGIVLWKMVLWSVIALVFIILTYLYYNRSRSENVHYTFNNGWVRDILLSLITISGMLLVGLIISFALPNLTVVYVLAFIIGAIFSYITQEMFFQGTAKIKFSRKSVLVTTISLVVFWVAFIIGWQQYSSYVPNESNVESVSINGQWNSSTWMTGRGESIMKEEYLFIDDPSIISEGITLHQEAVDTENIPENGEAQSFEIIYRMKDGSYVNRSYDNIPLESEQYGTIMERLNSGEFSKTYDVIYNIEDADQISSLELYGTEGNTTIENRDDIAEFINDYQQAAHQIDAQVPVLVNSWNNSVISASINSDNSYHNGIVSIYNSALIDKVMEDQELADFLGMESSQKMYTISLSGDQKEEFFRDYETTPFDALADMYDLQPLDEEKDEVMASIDDGELDPDGDRILLYSPEYMQAQDMGTAGEQATAADEYFILGIE